MAERHLAAVGLDPAALEFKEGGSEQRPARLDHEFTWKDPARSAGEAEYLVTVAVQGDRVDAEQRRLKLPKAWERGPGAADRAALRPARGKDRHALAARRSRTARVLPRHPRRRLPWRRIGVAASLFAVPAVLALSLELRLAWAQYQTSMPEALFRVSLLLGFAVTAVLLVAMIVLALGTLAACFPQAVAITVRAARRGAGASAAWVALAVLGAWSVLAGVKALVLAAAPRLFPDVPVGVPSEVATALPGSPPSAARRPGRCSRWRSPRSPPTSGSGSGGRRCAGCSPPASSSR